MQQLNAPRFKLPLKPKDAVYPPYKHLYRDAIAEYSALRENKQGTARFYKYSHTC